jgi:hypothetical protein
MLKARAAFELSYQSSVGSLAETTSLFHIAGSAWRWSGFPAARLEGRSVTILNCGLNDAGEPNLARDRRACEGVRDQAAFRDWAA